MFHFLKFNKTQRLFAIGLLAGLAFFLAVSAWPLIRSRVTGHRSQAPILGITFSIKYARELGLDWKEAFIATLDDLKVRHYRIPVYWDEVERAKGKLDWSEYDWMLEEAGKRGAEVILAVGRKVPRWPECHAPGWAKGKGPSSKGQEDDALMKFLAAEIEHFKSFPAITTWQVENEPLFEFGKCPEPDRALLKREVELVRKLDTRPVMITDSGELSTWIRAATVGDVLGISMYRMVWNKYLGGLYWPVSPTYYAERINLIKGSIVEEVMISELQAEPWFQKPVADTPLEEQFEQMNPGQMNSNVEFAERTGVGAVLLWGAEWWYWVRVHERPEMWEAAKKLFS